MTLLKFEFFDKGEMRYGPPQKVVSVKGSCIVLENGKKWNWSGHACRRHCWLFHPPPLVAPSGLNILPPNLFQAWGLPLQLYCRYQLHPFTDPRHTAVHTGYQLNTSCSIKPYSCRQLAHSPCSVRPVHVPTLPHLILSSECMSACISD